MSAVVGIDLSSHAIDLVRLDETDNQAEWLRVTLEGAKAWDRARTIRDRMPPVSWWDNVYLAAIERPFSRSRNDVVRLAEGAVIACIPDSVLVWEVAPHTWKSHIGFKGRGKPSLDDFPTEFAHYSNAQFPWPQDAVDALGVAYYARETNAKGIAA